MKAEDILPDDISIANFGSLANAKTYLDKASSADAKTGRVIDARCPARIAGLERI